VAVLSAVVTLQAGNEETSDGRVHLLNDQDIQVFIQSTRFPADVQTVAVMPVTVPAVSNSLVLEHGQRGLTRVLPAALQKVGAFRPVFLTPDQVEIWTGRSQWRSSEPLPEDLLQTFQKAGQVQGLLFCEMTAYDPFQDYQLGLRCHLVDVRDGSTIWQMDHLFRGRAVTARDENRKGKLGRLFNLDRVLGLPDGTPEPVRTTAPAGDQFIREALDKAFSSIPLR